MIVPIMIFSIPIVAIVCSTIVKLARLGMDADNKQASEAEITALKKQMLYLEAEQENLLQRIEQLENNQRQQGFPIEELEKIEINKQKMKR